jgi:hypothetical protein
MKISSLNTAQLEILALLDQELSHDDLKEIKLLISNYLAEKAMQKADEMMMVKEDAEFWHKSIAFGHDRISSSHKSD